MNKTTIIQIIRAVTLLGGIQATAYAVSTEGTQVLAAIGGGILIGTFIYMLEYPLGD